VSTLTVELTASLVSVADLRPLPGRPPPCPKLVAALSTSFREHGILEPLLVRPARQTWILQSGRRRGVPGWFVLDTERVRRWSYRGEPAFYSTHKAASRALPADVPFEVVRGLGRLAAAKANRTRLVPCLIRELSDDQVEALRAFG